MGGASSAQACGGGDEGRPAWTATLALTFTNGTASPGSFIVRPSAELLLE